MRTEQQKATSSNEGTSADTGAGDQADMRGKTNVGETDARKGGIQPGQEEKLRGVFRSFDRDGNGHLSVQEFSDMMSELGTKMDTGTAREVILRD